MPSQRTAFGLRARGKGPLGASIAKSDRMLNSEFNAQRQ
jgi:hypothetical protein